MSYVKHFKIYSPKIFIPKRALVLSDLHINKKNSDEHINILIKEVRSMDNIDLILMPGDLIHDESILSIDEYRAKIVSQIIALTNGIPTFICAGNHDKTVFEPIFKNKVESNRLKELLSPIDNVTFLDNSNVDFQELRIGDFTPSVDYYAIHKGSPKALKAEYQSLLPRFNFSEDLYNILLTHDPLSLISIAKEEGNLIPNVDLTISGHTHNGLVHHKLQGNKTTGLASPNRTLFPKNAIGNYHFDNNIYLINGAVNSLVEYPLVNKILGINYTIVELDRGPTLSYIRKS